MIKVDRDNHASGAGTKTGDEAGRIIDPKDINMNDKPIAAGKSSFDLIDAEKLFSALNLRPDHVFIDVACGNGAYSLAASEYISPPGKIHAVDLWPEGIEALKKETSARRIQNIHAEVVDVSQRIPLEDQSADICLLATVLHDLVQDKTDEGALKEINRVLKTRGRLAIVEFKKIEGIPGPPLNIKMSPEEVETLLSLYSYRVIRTIDIGPYNYLSMFTRSL